jgi:hypothetical protein
LGDGWVSEPAIESGSARAAVYRGVGGTGWYGWIWVGCAAVDGPGARSGRSEADAGAGGRDADRGSDREPVTKVADRRGNAKNAGPWGRATTPIQEEDLSGAPVPGRGWTVTTVQYNNNVVAGCPGILRVSAESRLAWAG